MYKVQVNSLLCFICLHYSYLYLPCKDDLPSQAYLHRPGQETHYGYIWPHSFNFIPIDYLTHKEFFSNYLDRPTRPLNFRERTIILLPVLRPKYTFALPKFMYFKFIMQTQDLKKLEQTQFCCLLYRAAELRKKLIWPNFLMWIYCSWKTLHLW